MGTNGSDALGDCWRRAARRFEPIGREIAARTRWLVFNPGRYGERWHARFRRAHPLAPRPLLVCGLNPGPYGMAQTGVPFTDLSRMQSHLPALWQELVAAGEPVARPGLAPAGLRPFLTRTFESSSVRVYRFLDHAFGSAEAAFRELVVVNPCPLLFIEMGEKGKERGENRTPADLPPDLLPRFDALRRATVVDALERLAPRAAILLGRNVAAALGETLREALGAPRVVEWEHPARAVPDTWSRGLTNELARRRLLRR